MEITRVNVEISGLADIMFNRFYDHSKVIRPPEQLLYYGQDNEVVFPADNMRSFLFGEKPPGCAKTMEGKKSKDFIRWGQGHIHIDPLNIPFKTAGEPVIFKGVENGLFYVHTAAPRTNGIKQEAIDRPVLRLPWELEFNITIVENPLVDQIRLYNWFVMGGLLIAIGNYRPVYGRFEVKKWEVEEKVDYQKEAETEKSAV